jgi:hypothetical protein
MRRGLWPVNKCRGSILHLDQRLQLILFFPPSNMPIWKTSMIGALNKSDHHSRSGFTKQQRITEEALKLPF